MRLIFHKIPNNRIYQSFLPGVRINGTCRIQVNSHLFCFNPTSTMSAVTSCLRGGLLELMLYAIFCYGNYSENACTSRSSLATQSSFALSLRLSLFSKDSCYKSAFAHQMFLPCLAIWYRVSLVPQSAHCVRSVGPPIKYHLKHIY